MTRIPVRRSSTSFLSTKTRLPVNRSSNFLPSITNLTTTFNSNSTTTFHSTLTFHLTTTMTTKTTFVSNDLAGMGALETTLNPGISYHRVGDASTLMTLVVSITPVTLKIIRLTRATTLAVNLRPWTATLMTLTSS